jgi:polysaccharide biosynthesis transport protein
VKAVDEPLRADRATADLRDYLKIAWKRRWSILGVLAVTVGSAIAFVSYQIPIFDAFATVLIEPHSPRVVPIPDVAQEGGASGWSEFYATQTTIIGSRPIVEGAIERMKLKKRMPDLPADSYWFVKSRLTVVPLKQTRLVMVMISDPDPKFAAEMANAVANEFVNQNLELKHKAAQEATAWLDEQLGTLKAKAQQSAKALQTYQAQADLVGVQEQRQITQAKAVESHRAYLEAQNQRLGIEAKFRELSRIAKDPTAAETMSLVADDPLIRKLKTESSDLQIERSKLAQISKDKHPDLLQIDAQLKQVQQRLQAEIQKLLRSVETEYNVAKMREAALLANVSELKREARALTERETQALALQRERDTSDELHAAVLKRFRETGIATALEANNVRIVEPATTPGLPSRPRKNLIYTLSVVGGLALGIGVALLAESLDNRVRSPEDVERAVGLPILGIVPVFHARRDG